jgi:autotransporter-associated beta strand protein
MTTTRKPLHVLSALIVCATFLCVQSVPAAVWYWDNNGLSAPNSGTWDNSTADWATTSALTASPSVWNGANAAGFPAGTAGINALTITLSGTLATGGIFNGLQTGIGVTNLTIQGGGNLSLNSGIDAFYNGAATYNTIIKSVVSGTGMMQSQSSGSLYLAGNNTFSGGFSFNSGAGVNFNNAGAFGTGAITNTVSATVMATPATDSVGGAFATAPITVANAVNTCGAASSTIFVGLAAAPTTFSGAWSLKGNYSFQNQPAGTAVTISGPISGAFNFTKLGAGTLTNSGANTYSGTTTINAGVLSISADSGLGTAPASATAGSVTINGGTLQHTSAGVGSTFMNGNRGIAIGASGGTIAIPASGAILTYTSGQITGSGNTVTKSGAGTFRYTTPTSTTFSKLVVNGGLWQGAVDTVFGAVPGSFTANAITLNGGGISVNAGVTLSANRGITLGASGGTVDGASSPVLPMIITGSGNLTKTGTGTATLSGVNTYTGKTIVNGGTLTINTSGDAALGAAPASFVPDQLTLAANTTFSLGSAANTTLNFNRGITLGGSVTNSLTSKDLTVPGIIAGTGGSLTKLGANALILSGANTFDGGVTLGAGTLTVNNNAALGTGTLTITPAGLCTVAGKSGTTVLANNIVVNAGGGQVIDFFATTGNALTLNGQITGSANITRGNGGGAGNLTLNGNNSTFSGNVNLVQGPLVLGHQNALGTGTLIVTPGSVAISLAANTALTGANAVSNSVTLNGTLPVNTASDLELAGVLSGASGALTKSGSGTLILDANETYAGATTVTGGKLALNGGATLATSALTIGSAGTLDVSALTSSTYAPGVALTASGSSTSSATIVGAPAGMVDLGNTNISLSFAPTTFNGDLTHPGLTISQGTLSVNGNAISVANTGGTPLGGGTYTLIKQASGNLTVASAPSLGVVSGLASGATAQLVVNNGEIDLVVSVPATFGNLTASQSISYGTPSVSLAGTVSGAGPNYPADGDTVSVTINGNTQTTVTTGGNGSFSIVFPTATLQASGTPYAITYSYAGAGVISAGNNTSTTLTVTPSALTVTANDRSKVYGQTIATGAGQTQFSNGALQNSETVGTVTLTVSSGGDGVNAAVAGSPYIITPSAATGGTFNPNNYNITYVAGNLTVTAASLTVTANGSLTYGEDPSNAVYVASYSPLQGTDDVSVVSGTGNYSTDATATNYVGTNYVAHIVDLGTLSSPNYTLVAGLDGVMAITNRPLYVTNVSASDKIYDATTAATADVSGAGLTNFVNGDDASVSLVTSNAVAAFADKNAGSNKTVTVTGLVTTGDLGTNYFVVPATTTASIAQLVSTVGITGNDKTYDGTSNATVNVSFTPLGSDVASPSYTTAFFDDKNAGIGKNVSVSGIALAGADAANYSVPSTGSTTASINQASLTVSAAGVNKVYDGTTAATVTLSDNRSLGDAVTDSYSSATFADRNVAPGIAVAVSGISISGADAANYTLANTTAATSADITQRSLTVTATGINKVYDGATAATVNLSDDRVLGDAVSDSYTSAAFADKNVNTGIAVSVSGISISGGDAGNYALVSTTASTTANITSTGLTVSGVVVLDKVYDGTTNATVILTNAALVGVAGGDDVTLVTSNALATFADKNVGSNQVVTVTALSIVGADAGNYSFASSLTTNASITPATLTVSATGVNKVYDGTTVATVNLSDDKIAGDAVTDAYTSAAFADKNVNTGIAVSVSGISISGADAANYSLVNTSTATVADITARTLTVSGVAANKVYDGTTTASVTLSDDKVPGDDVAETNSAANFADANVGTGKTVTVSGIGISGGADASNYALASSTATTTADITALASSAGIVSSLNPSTETSNVTFTATISAGVGTPAGDVVFLANGTPFSTNTLVSGVAAASNASLPVGTNSIAVQYSAQGNYLSSSASLDQVVNSGVTLSVTNLILSIVNNGDETYDLDVQGTPSAVYYLETTSDLTPPISWTIVPGSTNTASSGDGTWSATVSAAPPAYFRSKAVNPAP